MGHQPHGRKEKGCGIFDWLRPAKRPEKSLLLMFLSLSACLYLFIKLAEEIGEGETKELDKSILLLFRDPSNLSHGIGPYWLEEAMRDLTSLGSIPILAMIALAVMGFLFINRKRHAAWMICLSVSIGMGMSSLLKWFFNRPRPDLVPHATVVYTQSFPSGHAMLSAVVYLTLGALLARTQKNVCAKLYLLSLAAALTIAVGISRIYLGVHWPTDVLGGWAIGSAWALFCWLLMLWLQNKGKVEGP
jgi:undecaprenyl-diphosphatase